MKPVEPNVIAIASKEKRSSNKSPIIGAIVIPNSMDAKFSDIIAPRAWG